MEITYTSDVFLTAYFVYVSGEQLGLAKAEIAALSSLTRIDGEVSWDGRLGLINALESPVPFILERAALVKEAGIVLVEIGARDNLFDHLSDDTVLNAIKSEETFSVRTISENSNFSVDERLELEKRLGKYIKRTVSAGVDLKSPQVRFIVILNRNHIRLCKAVGSKLRPMLREREPGRKPFFHPSMMNATLARVMCNLACVMPDEIVLDPFCGGGGILCEAFLIGAKSVGVDLNWQLLTGSRQNLSLIGSDYNVVQGDVRHLPVHECDCIVTDPPYGRASSTRGARAIGLVESLFERADAILRRRDESICICGSSEMNLRDLAESKGLVVSQFLQIRVHRGLVREILSIGFQ